MLLAMRRASSSVSTLALVRVALAEGQLVPFAGIGAEVFGEFVGHVHKGVSGGAGFFFVMLGQTAEYWRLMSSHFSRPGSVSGLIASTGHSGSQTPQSMHSSGWMTSMFSPS
jgi:hypothetical protein